MTEQTTTLTPKFDANGLLPCITINATTGDIAMFAYMNKESFDKTLETGEVYYYSRSRNELWHKGATSGTVQTVRSIRIDCDQDCIIATVDIAGNGTGCHTGRSTCFYRKIMKNENGEYILDFIED